MEMKTDYYSLQAKDAKEDEIVASAFMTILVVLTISIILFIASHFFPVLLPFSRMFLLADVAVFPIAILIIYVRRKVMKR